MKFTKKSPVSCLVGLANEIAVLLFCQMVMGALQIFQSFKEMIEIFEMFC